MWLTTGSILATFNIGKPLDGNGNPIEVSGEIDSGNIWYAFICAQSINSTDLDALATISRSSAQLHPAPKKLRESSEIRRLRKLRDTFFHAEQLAPFYFVNLEI